MKIFHIWTSIQQLSTQVYKAEYFNLLKAFEISKGHRFIICIWLLGNHWHYSGPRWWTHRQADYHPWSRSANVTKNDDKEDTVSSHGTRLVVSCSSHVNVLMHGVILFHNAASWKPCWQANKANKACMEDEVLQEAFFFVSSHCTIIWLWWFAVSPSAQLCLWTLDTIIMELWARCKFLTHHCILYPPGLVCHPCQCRLSHCSIFMYTAIFGPAAFRLLFLNWAELWVFGDSPSQTWN